MSSCVHCKAEVTDDRRLCPTCVEDLGNMLDSLAWLYGDLQTTMLRQDRVVRTSVGKTTDPRSPINFDALDLIAEIDAGLAKWIGQLVAEQRLKFLPDGVVPSEVQGPLRRHERRLPKGYSGSVPQRTRWLAKHLNVLATREDADEFYLLIEGWVGNPNRLLQEGTVVACIDLPVERRSAGPCHTITGYDREGLPVTCAQMLWGLPDESDVTCPKCGETVNVRRNLSATLTDRDLMPEATLLETLQAVGEPVSRSRFYEWIKAGRLKPQGWIYAGRIVEAKVRHKDPAVFSMDRCKHLRRQDFERKVKAS